MTTRDTRDEQLSDREYESALHATAFMRYSEREEAKSVLRADRCALKDEIKTLRAENERLLFANRTIRAQQREDWERAEKAERTLAELVDVVANRPLDSEQVHSAFIRARDLVKEGEDV